MSSTSSRSVTPAADHGRPGSARGHRLEFSPVPESPRGFRPVRAPWSAGAGVPRDGRVSVMEKEHLGPVGREFIAMLRQAVLAACAPPEPANPPGAHAERTTRAKIAEAMEVSEKVLEKWLTPSDPLCPRFDKVLLLLAPDGPLPAKQRGWVLAWLDRNLGRLSVDLCAADPGSGGGGIAAQVLAVFASGGRVAELVGHLQEEGSEGGREITPAEARQLLPAVREDLQRLAELEATLNDLAKREVGR